MSKALKALQTDLGLVFFRIWRIY